MSQDQKAAPPSGGASGSICGKTGLYKASDGKITSVLLVKAGDPFPKFPGGTGTTSTTWTSVSATSDGSRGTFESVNVAAGTI